jgi:integrase/recombinase XerD
MTLPELAEAFLTANKNRLSPNSLRAYGYDLGLLVRELPEAAAEEVTVVLLRAFLQATAESTPSTLARRQATLRACFSWAYKNDLLPADPTVKLEAVRLPERAPRPLSAEQVEAILAAIPTTQKRNRLLLSLLYETGIRVGEALGILVPHIHMNDVDGGYIRVLGKGDRERIVPLIDAPRTVRLLREMLKTLGTAGPLFRGDLRKGGRAGEAVDYTTLYYHFERYLEIARQKKPALFPADAEEITEKITIHRLRHTYATQKLRDGIPLPSVRKLMGHKNLQTTLRYAETDLETIKRQLVEARKRRR